MIGRCVVVELLPIAPQQAVIRPNPEIIGARPALERSLRELRRRDINGLICTLRYPAYQPMAPAMTVMSVFAG